MLKKYLKSAIYSILFAYVCISVLSYNHQDSSLNTATYTKASNLGGAVGAYLADILIQFLGFTSVTIIAAIGYLLICKQHYVVLKGLYLVFVNLGLSVLFSKFPMIMRYNGGGMLGNVLCDHLGLYPSIIAALLGVLGLVGWRKVDILFSLCKKLISLFFRFMRHNHDVCRLEMGEQKCKQNDKQGNKQVIKKSKKCDQAYGFALPSIDLLSKGQELLKKKSVNEAENNRVLSLLEKVLNDFGIEGQIINICYGPVVTLYKLEPQAGTKSARVIGLADDIARSMSALSARIAIIRGQNAIGIELPNKEREIVMLRDLLETPEYQNSNLHLPIALGKEISGKPVVTDLTKMPHLLVAGTTGSGKSVAINTMVLSLVYKLTPDECKMIMIDPKMLELSMYNPIPHLIAPVVTEPKKAITALKWVVKEMENRYRMMSYLNVRNLISYNQKIVDAINNKVVLERMVQIGFDSTTGKPIFEKIPIKMEKFPYIVVIVDEMADLMLVAGKEIECSIQRLAQMARAAGIHIIMATQRPSVDVITGVIKANFPTRISFAVTSKIDSRTILGEQGAEQLLGMGDMLYMSSGGKIIRVHGPFVNDDEVQDTVDHLKTQGKPNYIEEITKEDDPSLVDMEGYAQCDDLYNQAVSIIQRDQKVSVSYVQRQLRIGYNRAADIVERMEKEGIVSPPNHVGKREILIK